MAATVLQAIKNAMLSIGAIGIRQTPAAHDADYCLQKAQDLILSLPNWGHWIEVETTEDYTAGTYGANERIAVIGDVSVTVTLPQMVVADPWQMASLPGFTIRVDQNFAAPRDGARVLVYAQQGTDKAFYAYRSDTGKWLSVFGLALDSELPINSDLHGSFEAMLALEIAGAYGVNVPETVAKKAIEGERRFGARFLFVPEAKIDAGITRDYDRPIF